jgi:hypothetical protein
MTERGVKKPAKRKNEKGVMLRAEAHPFRFTLQHDCSVKGKG